DVAAHGRAPVPRLCGPVLQQRAARRSAEAVRRSLTLFHIHRVPTQDDVTAGSTQDVIGAFATADEIVSIATFNAIVAAAADECVVAPESEHLHGVGAP